MLHEVVIADKNGVPRWSAFGKTWDETINQAIKMASEYAVERPDLMPFHHVLTRDHE